MALEITGHAENAEEIIDIKPDPRRDLVFLVKSSEFIRLRTVNLHRNENRIAHCGLTRGLVVWSGLVIVCWFRSSVHKLWTPNTDS